MFVQWSDEYQVLTDEMGLPISLTAAKEIIVLAKAHLKKSPVQIAISYEASMRKLYPGMAKQMDVTAHKFL